MSELHKRHEELIFVPKEGQRSPLCSNKGSSRCPSFGENQFSQETIDSLMELGEVLKSISKRMLEEGYTVVDGKLKKLDAIKHQ